MNKLQQDAIEDLYEIASKLKEIADGTRQGMHITSHSLNNIRKVFGFDLRETLMDKTKMKQRGYKLKRGQTHFITADAYNNMGKDIAHYLHLNTQIKRANQ